MPRLQKGDTIQRTKVALENFIDARALGLTLAEAARRCGYTGNDNTLSVAGARLQAKPGAMAAIEERRRMISETRSHALIQDHVPNAEQVLRELADVLVKAKETGNLGARLKGIELLGREYNLFTVKTEVKVDQPLAGLSAADMVDQLPLLRAALASLVADTAAIAATADEVVEGVAEAEDDPLA